MSMYTVHVRASDFDRPQAADGAIYVREGFGWGAYLFAPLWCVYRRCWLALMMWLTAAGLVFLVGWWLEIAPVAIAGCLFILQILFGFEAAQFRRRSLARRSYQLADVVSGHGRSEAETTFALRRAAQFDANGAPAQPLAFGAPSRPRPVTAAEGYGLSPLGGGT